MIMPYFEMQKRGRGSSCGTHLAYGLFLLHLLPHRHKIHRVMRVNGLKSIAMIQNNHVPIAFDLIARKRHLPIQRRLNGRSRQGLDVNPLIGDIIFHIAETGENLSRNRPLKYGKTHSSGRRERGNPAGRRRQRKRGWELAVRSRLSSRATG